MEIPHYPHPHQPSATSCGTCETLIIKYKHYKKKFERERLANEQLQNQLRELQGQAHHHSEPPAARQGVPGSVLGKDFDRLGNELETLIARNVELEGKLAEMSNRNTDLKNCLLIAQSRKQNLQNVLLTNMRVYERSLEQSCILESATKADPSTSPNDIVLMEQLFGIQENIEQILMAEVSYLRELVTSQQYALINRHPDDQQQFENFYTNRVDDNRSGMMKAQYPGFDFENVDRHAVRALPTQTDPCDDNAPQVIVSEDEAEEHNRSILDTVDHWADNDEVVKAYSEIYNHDNSGFKRRATTRTRTLASRRIDSPTAKFVPIEMRQQLKQSAQSRSSSRLAGSSNRRKSTNLSATVSNSVAKGKLFSGNSQSSIYSNSRSSSANNIRNSSCTTKTLLGASTMAGKYSRAISTASTRVKKAKSSRKWATAALQAEIDKLLRDISGVVV